MTLMLFAIFASTVIKATVFLVYLYLYLHYRERFLGMWTLAWGLIVVKALFDPFVLNVTQQPLIFVMFHITGMISVLALAWGTADFAGKQLPKSLIYSAIIVSIFADLGIFLQVPPPYLIIPTAFLYGTIYIHTGRILLRGPETQGYGKKLTGYAFIIVGIHQLDFPIFRPTDMAPWGYLLDSSLRLIIAVGFLLTYFEKTRYDLVKKEEQFRLLAENAKDIVYRYRLFPKPRCEYISPAVKEITGYDPEDFYADPELILGIVEPGEQEKIDFRHLLALADKPVSLRITRKDKSQIWVEQSTVPIHEGGGIAAIEGIIRDITARRQLEQELFRLDRLNIVGQMAANIGHEIRNPLTTVRGYLQVLSRKQDLAPYLNNLGLLVEELDRANGLISEYLSLAKNRLTDQRSANLNEIIESLAPLIRADAAATNHIVKLELGDIPNLILDEKEIRQLILNLTRNGLEAMSPGKTLTIKTYRGKNSVVLAVQDEGQEISADTMEKLGLPFFTTKENGTGLGLAICYSIANRHRARIDVATGRQGTTFLVSFQCIDFL